MDREKNFPYVIKRLDKRSDSLYVELENTPVELSNPALWSYLQTLRHRNINPISFQVLTENRSNTPMYNFTRFIYSNYPRIRELYRSMKKALKSSSLNIEFQVPEAVEDKLAESFVNQLKQLASLGILINVDYTDRMIKVGQVLDATFLTGGWFEFAVADQIMKICPFPNAIVLKNFSFSVSGAKNEADLVLIHERTSFLFEIKTGIRFQSLEDTHYKLLRKGYLLNAENVCLIVPSIEDISVSEDQDEEAKQEDHTQSIHEKLRGVHLLSIQNIDSKLKSMFIGEMLKHYEQ
ncbi:nuclease-related domain-containing protein [Thermocrinis sp.]|uniref:nuclease-related domain-containing protein n=1 Tax=Thermocrinis sp. TaxID=2024383 RepID=UPI002FDEC0BB